MPPAIMRPAGIRPSGRTADSLREISLSTGFSHHAEGSCLIRMGNTEVLCAASVESKVPPFMRNSGLGWVTAEYGMLPRATHTRGDREAARGKQSGRTQEIQRLIGRSLRAVVDRAAMGEMSITLDCDVLNADGGTRCAAITGAWVALSLAFRHLVKMNVIKAVPLTGQVAAVSCGIVGGAAVLDLDTTRIRMRRRRQLRADRRWRHRRNPGDGGKDGFPGSSVQRIAWPCPQRHRRAVRTATSGTRRLMPRKLARGQKLVLASHNPGKLREIEALLQPLGIEVVSAGALGLPEPEETAPDFAGNARIKALASSTASSLPALSDDSGFLRGRAERRSGRAVSPLGRSREGLCRGDGSGQSADRGQSGQAGLVHRRAMPGMARWAYRDVRRPYRWVRRLAAARRQGVRL